MDLWPMIRQAYEVCLAYTSLLCLRKLHFISLPLDEMPHVRQYFILCYYSFCTFFHTFQYAFGCWYLSFLLEKWIMSSQLFKKGDCNYKVPKHRQLTH